MDSAAALRLIAAGSPDAARLALRALRSTAPEPVRQTMINRIVEVALTDPQADFSPDQRAQLAGLIEVADSDDRRSDTLRFRVTPAEAEQVRGDADAAGLDLSAYVRRALGL